MNNLRLFQRLVFGKSFWDHRDWIAFVNALFIDSIQDNQVLALKDRLLYENRLPTQQEIRSILSVIYNTYSLIGFKSNYIINPYSGFINELNTTLNELINNNINGVKGLAFTDDFTNPSAAFSGSWGTGGAVVPTVANKTAIFTSGSGVSTWDRYARVVTNFVNINKWKITISNIKMTSVPDATSFGIGIGMMSVANRTLAQSSIGAYFDLSTGANTGKLRIGRMDNTAAWTNMAETSVSAVPYAQNNELLYELSLDDIVVTFKVTNITQNRSATLTYTYILDIPTTFFLVNRALTCVWSLGTTGTVIIGKVDFESNEKTINDYVGIGDSILRGYSNLVTSSRILEKAFKNELANRTFINLANQGNLVEDYTTGNYTETLMYLPRKAYIIQVGTNNKEHSTLVSYQNGMDSLVTAILAAGGNCVICKLIPRNDAIDVTNFNDHLTARFAPGGTFGKTIKLITLISTYSAPLYKDTANTVHLSQLGAELAGQNLRNGLVQFEAGNLFPV